MQVHIDVTQEDIDTGERFKPAGCPIHLALARTPCNADKLRVNQRFLYWHQGHIVVADWPKKVTKWINDFDLGVKPVKPIAFDIVLPVEVLA